jgi:biopolymer transport protein ExbD
VDTLRVFSKTKEEKMIETTTINVAIMVGVLLVVAIIFIIAIKRELK